ncbi:DUF4232 domain-containing protein [Actinomadura kijaniata]|uniref:DUF4232 domain-containing protein n=1 Tax=Actinomadura kijaniata TaxID=46161 RepID=UPI003F1BF9B1
MRKLLTGTLVAATAVTGMATVATGAQAATAKPVAKCSAAALKTKFVKARGEVGMMKTGWRITLTNVSKKTCTVKGYANLQLRNAKGKPVKTRVVRGDNYFQRDPGPVTLKLKPGKTVQASVSYSHYRDETGPAKTPLLSITAPGAKKATTVKMPDPYVWQGKFSLTAFAYSFPQA